MISFTKQFIFIHIPKTAGTSIEICLEDNSCILKREEIGNYERPLNHLTLEQVLNCESVNPSTVMPFFKFAFVRNPWDKVISECFCPHIKFIFKNDQTIKQKIKTVCLWSRNGGYGGHCQKQVDFIKTKKTSLDFIGRFENLQKDYKYICNLLDIPCVALPHKYKSKRVHYSKYFDKETKELVYNSYREDIENFHYRY